MNIIVVTGFTSSDDYTNQSGRSRLAPDLIEDADVVIGIWPPKGEAIVLRAPEGVTIGAVQAHHMKPPTRHGSITPEQFQAEIDSR